MHLVSTFILYPFCVYRGGRIRAFQLLPLKQKSLPLTVTELWLGNHYYSHPRIDHNSAYIKDVASVNDYFYYDLYSICIRKNILYIFKSNLQVGGLTGAARCHNNHASAVLSIGIGSVTALPDPLFSNRRQF